MLYYIDSSGVVQAAIPDTVTQGAINVNDIVIIAPFPISTVVTAEITLPNGMKIYPRYVGYEEIRESDYAYKFAPITAFEGKIPAPDGVTVNVWKMTLDRALAQKAGALRLTFLFTDAYGHTLPSTEVTLNVGRASPYLAPTVTAQDINTIAEYLAVMQTLIASAEEIAASVQKQWSIVIDESNKDKLATLDVNTAESILVTGVDLTDVELPTREIDGNTYNCIFVNHATKIIVFRACKYNGTRPLVINGKINDVNNEPPQTKIIGVDFGGNNYGNVYEIRQFSSVEHCQALSLIACTYISDCRANEAAGCDYIINSYIPNLNPNECKFVDPFSVGAKFGLTTDAIPVKKLNGGIAFTDCAKAVELSVDNDTFVLTVTLKGINGTALSSATVDFPIEQIVVSGTVSANGDELILTLKNGETITIPVSNIVAGLVEQTSTVNQIYGTDASGNQVTLTYGKAASPNAIVQRTSLGNINLPETQENDEQAVRKSYVDKIGERVYYDHVITDEETLLLLNQFTGRILVKDVVLTQSAFGDNTILEANANATLIEFVNLTFGSPLGNPFFTIKGNSNCTLKGFSVQQGYNFITIDGFHVVEHCDTSGYDSGSIVNCGAVRDCKTSYMRNCEFVSDCLMYADSDALLVNCKYVCGIYQEEGNLGGGTTVTCDSCQFVSNVNAEGVYQNCTYVDPNTCKGFIQSTDVGKVQKLTSGGTFETMSVVEQVNRAGTQVYTSNNGVQGSIQASATSVTPTDGASGAVIPMRTSTGQIVGPNQVTTPPDIDEYVTRRIADQKIPLPTNNAPYDKIARIKRNGGGVDYLIVTSGKAGDSVPVRDPDGSMRAHYSKDGEYTTDDTLVNHGGLNAALGLIAQAKISGQSLSSGSVEQIGLEEYGNFFILGEDIKVDYTSQNNGSQSITSDFHLIVKFPGWIIHIYKTGGFVPSISSFTDGLSSGLTVTNNGASGMRFVKEIMEAI